MLAIDFIQVLKSFALTKGYQLDHLDQLVLALCFFKSLLTRNRSLQRLTIVAALALQSQYSCLRNDTLLRIQPLALPRCSIA